jgi:uncharacterized membrane protein
MTPSEPALRATLATIAAVGAAVAAYLLAHVITGTAPACATGGCEAVQASEYAKFLGVPMPLLGLGAWLALLASALASGPTWRTAGALVALVGAAFSAYLIVLQVFTIHAICQWCIVSDGLMLVAAVVAVLRLRDV